MRVRIAPFPAVQSRDRTTAPRCDGEIGRFGDERAITVTRVGATGTITSDRNASASGDAYTREKNFFMVKPSL